MIVAGMGARRRRWPAVVCAVAVPLLVGFVCFATFINPRFREVRATVAAGRQAVERLQRVVVRGREVTSADADRAAEQVGWICQWVPRTAGAAVFVEELGELTRELGIGRFEYHQGTARIAADGYQVDPIDVRVVASYARLLALWERLDRLEPPILCRTMRLHRYGDRVAATFAIELVSRVSAVAEDTLRERGAG